jgi:hypothetical protein
MHFPSTWDCKDLPSQDEGHHQVIRPGTTAFRQVRDALTK